MSTLDERVRDWWLWLHISKNKKPERHISVADMQRRLLYFNRPITSNLLLCMVTNWCSDVFLMQIPLSWCQSVSRWVMFFDFYIPLIPESPPVCHTIIWPIQTLTALHSRACLTERSSWTASSRQSSLETHVCRCGGQVQSRPGWRLSWECPCTSEPALKTSKVARYTFGTRGSFAACLVCAWEWGTIWADGQI